MKDLLSPGLTPNTANGVLVCEVVLLESSMYDEAERLLCSGRTPIPGDYSPSMFPSPRAAVATG